MFLRATKRFKDRLAVRNMRNWGEVWLGTELWDMLGLDGFWSSRLPPSRKGTDWLSIMKAIVMYRLTDPGSELDMHTNWLANTAIEELIGPGALTGRSMLYSCLDWVMWSSEEWKKLRDELISRLAVAETKAGRAWKMIDIAIPRPTEKGTAETFRWKLPAMLSRSRMSRSYWIGSA